MIAAASGVATFPDADPNGRGRETGRALVLWSTRKDGQLTGAQLIRRAAFTIRIQGVPPRPATSINE